MATKLAPGQMQEVLETFMYEPEVFLVDEVTKLDYARREIEAMMDTRRDLPFARHQAKPSRRLPPLERLSRETRTRTGDRRLVIRYEFEFRQGDTPVYRGNQSVMFFKDSVFGQAR